MESNNANKMLNWSERNLSLFDDTEQPTVLSYVNIVTYILGGTFGLGMFLNLASIAAILRTTKLEPITLLILNLALADMVYIAGKV